MLLNLAGIIFSLPRQITIESPHFPAYFKVFCKRFLLTKYKKENELPWHLLQDLVSKTCILA